MGGRRPHFEQIPLIAAIRAVVRGAALTGEPPPAPVRAVARLLTPGRPKRLTGRKRRATVKFNGER